VETPWGTSSVDLADRFDALASQMQTLADAADKKDEQAIEEARAALLGTLEGLKPLISDFKKRCFAPIPAPTSNAPKVSGRVPPEVIQGTVRTLRPRFGQCYGAGLLRNPELKGFVTTQFVIVQDGTVPWAVLHQSNLPDKQVADCIVSEFTKLVFSPPPIGGIVTVVYPINFSPAPPEK